MHRLADTSDQRQTLFLRLRVQTRHPPPQDTLSKTYDGLFGRRAVEGHSFLLAKARDINAAAVAGVGVRTQQCARQHET